MTRIVKIILLILLIVSCDSKPTFEIPDGKVGVIGYGSLTSKASMEQTLGRTYDGPFEVVHLNGYQRVWNLNMKVKLIAKCITPFDTIAPENIVVLNIEKNEGKSINACLFVIEETDLSGFDKRERNYRRINVTESIEEFHVIGGPVFAYIGLPEHTREPEKNNISKNVISQNYLNTLYDAFSDLGEEYRSEFYRTTIPYDESLVLECYRVRDEGANKK